MKRPARTLFGVFLCALLCSTSGCMAIIEAPRFLGGTRGWINIAAGEKHWVARRAPRPYALASGAVGFGDLRPLILPFAIFDFVPSLAVDLLLLPISIPHSIRLELEETRAEEAEARRLQIEREQQQRRRGRQGRERAGEDAARHRQAERQAKIQRKRQESRRRAPRQRAQRQRAQRQRARSVDSAPQVLLNSGSSEAWAFRHDAARAALAEIARAQRAFQRSSPSGEFSDDLDSLLARGTARYRLPKGYTFRLARSGLAPAEDWIATAAPLREGPGARWFAVDSAGVVRSYAEPLGDLPWDCTLESLEPERPR